VYNIGSKFETSVSQKMNFGNGRISKYFSRLPPVLEWIYKACSCWLRSHVKVLCNKQSLLCYLVHLIRQ